VLSPRISYPIVLGVPAITAEEAKKSWGARIAEARREAGRTQVDVAATLGVDQTTVSQVERGTGSLETFIAVAAEIGIELLGGDS